MAGVWIFPGITKSKNKRSYTTSVLPNYLLISMKHDNPDSCLLNIANFPNQEEHFRSRLGKINDIKVNSEFK